MDNIEGDLAALNEHQNTILVSHKAAWMGPVQLHYNVGDTVWLWDHYNTAVIQGPGTKLGTWAVTTQDADGSTSRYEYHVRQIRPATEAMVFTWPHG
jgi:hypothetical protein